MTGHPRRHRSSTAPGAGRARPTSPSTATASPRSATVGGAAQRDDRRRRRDRHARLRRHPHPLRRPGHVGRRCMAPSSWHGVTTVVMGNCGVGFAPGAAGRPRPLIELMEGVEDIPGAALHEGLDWEWESFPEYLDALDRRHRDIDVGAQLPHGARAPVRDGRARRAAARTATADEIAEMGRIAAEAMEAGALGFTTSRTRNHRTSHGELDPDAHRRRRRAGRHRRVRSSGKGVLAGRVSDFADIDDELRHGARHGRGIRPAAVDLGRPGRPHAGRRAANLLAEITEANERGLQVTAQVAPRPVGMLLGSPGDDEPARRARPRRGSSPTCRSTSASPRCRDPTCARRSSPSSATHDDRWSWDARCSALGDPPDYEPAPEQQHRGRSPQRPASRRRRSPTTTCWRPTARRCCTCRCSTTPTATSTPSARCSHHEHTVVGLADGGAHVGTICDASFPTTLLTHWVRDRDRGERLASPRSSPSRRRAPRRSSASPTAACSPRACAPTSTSSTSTG